MFQLHKCLNSFFSFFIYCMVPYLCPLVQFLELSLDQSVLGKVHKNSSASQTRIQTEIPLLIPVSTSVVAQSIQQQGQFLFGDTCQYDIINSQFCVSDCKCTIRIMFYLKGVLKETFSESVGNKG